MADGMLRSIWARNRMLQLLVLALAFELLVCELLICELTSWGNVVLVTAYPAEAMSAAYGFEDACKCAGTCDMCDICEMALASELA
jgi:hypothetical protein